MKTLDIKFKLSRDYEATVQHAKEKNILEKKKKDILKILEDIYDPKIS